MPVRVKAQLLQMNVRPLPAPSTNITFFPLNRDSTLLLNVAKSPWNGIFQCQDPANCQTPFELPGFVRMDAALYYRKQEVFAKTNLLAAVNFTNLLDQRYFTGAQNFREIVYTGARLTVIGSLKFEFF